MREIVALKAQGKSLRAIAAEMQAKQSVLRSRSAS
jgi:hypothetical protein